LRLEWLAEQAHRLEFLSANEFGSDSNNRLVSMLRTEVNSVIVALLETLNG
jgi:hypothetical protein